MPTPLNVYEFIPKDYVEIVKQVPRVKGEINWNSSQIIKIKRKGFYREFRLQSLVLNLKKRVASNSTMKKMSSKDFMNKYIDGLQRSHISHFKTLNVNKLPSDGKFKPRTRAPSINKADPLDIQKLYPKHYRMIDKVFASEKKENGKIQWTSSKPFRLNEEFTFSLYTLYNHLSKFFGCKSTPTYPFMSKIIPELKKHHISDIDINKLGILPKQLEDDEKSTGKLPRPTAPKANPKDIEHPPDPIDTDVDDFEDDDALLRQAMDDELSLPNIYVWSQYMSPNYPQIGLEVTFHTFDGYFQIFCMRIVECETWEQVEHFFESDSKKYPYRILEGDTFKIYKHICGYETKDLKTLKSVPPLDIIGALDREETGQLYNYRFLETSPGAFNGKSLDDLYRSQQEYDNYNLGAVYFGKGDFFPVFDGEEFDNNLEECMGEIED